MRELICLQSPSPVKTPTGHKHLEEVNDKPSVFKEKQPALKSKSLIQPQSEMTGVIRKLPLKTCKLKGDETEFEWPHSKKDLMTVMIQNQ